jgi:hypothetical protein
MNLVSIWVDFVFFIFLRANGLNPPAADEPCSKPCLTLHLLSDIFHKHQKCQLFFK